MNNGQKGMYREKMHTLFAGGAITILAASGLQRAAHRIPEHRIRGYFPGSDLPYRRGISLFFRLWSETDNVRPSEKKALLPVHRSDRRNISPGGR